MVTWLNALLHILQTKARKTEKKDKKLFVIEMEYTAGKELSVQVISK